MDKILIIEDDETIRIGLKYYLNAENFETFEIGTCKGVTDIIKNNDISLILLDLNLPDGNGFDLFKEIKKEKDLPVIFLTANDLEVSIVRGLDMGADDYITKPFNPMELVARVNSQIRRYTKLGSINKKEENEDIYKSGELVIDDSKKEVTVDGKNIKLTPTEYNILKFLTKNKGKVFSISQIYENVWEEESYGAENIIAVHIRHIREKIEINPREPKYLKVIWGIGYKIENI